MLTKTTKAVIYTSLGIMFLLNACTPQNGLIRSSDVNVHPVRTKELSRLPKRDAMEHVVIDTLPSQVSMHHMADLSEQKSTQSPSFKEREKPIKRNNKSAIKLLTHFGASSKDIAFQKPEITSKTLGDGKTHWSATMSLVMGILGFVLLPVIGSLLAVIFGIIALNKIGEEGSQYSGRGLAVAGLILGIVGLLLFGLFLGILLVSIL